MADITAKQKMFADEYILTGNAKQSYVKVYKTNDKVAEASSSRLLSNVKVSAYIAERMAEKDNKMIASQNEVLEYLTKVMRGEMKEDCVVVESIGDFMSEAKIIKKQVTPKDRLKAAELIGKRYSLFTDKTEITGNVGVQIVDDIE